MKKRCKQLAYLILVFTMIIMVLTGCQSSTKTETTTAAGTTAAAETAKVEKLTVGYIMGGPDLWNQSQSDGIQYACKKLGYEFISVNSEYTSEKELSNAEDLISKKVNAIIMFTVNSVTGQKVAQLSNEANIPLFLLDADVGEGPGKAVTVATYDFYACGKIVGEWVSKTMPNSKLAFIMGLPGAGITEEYQRGLEDGISNGVKLVDVKAADWDRAKAMSVMENMLSSKEEIDVVYVNNDDMAVGVVKALKDAGELGKIKVVTDNGSPDAVEMLKNDEIIMTITESPSYEGVADVKAIYDYFKGVEVPKKILVPEIVVTKDNLQDILTWGVDDNLLKQVGINF
jgi:ribose transport system substrate-binding protein